jgi:hypothetical protein
MGKRKITILETAVSAVAEIALYIEGQGLPETAKKFVDNAFEFFVQLSDDIMEHKPCTNNLWKDLDYRCITYKKKYVVAYLSQEKEIVICDFVSAKLLK